MVLDVAVIVVHLLYCTCGILEILYLMFTQGTVIEVYLGCTVRVVCLRYSTRGVDLKEFSSLFCSDPQNC